jgi:hypothetical protein
MLHVLPLFDVICGFRPNLTFCKSWVIVEGSTTGDVTVSQVSPSFIILTNEEAFSMNLC